MSEEGREKASERLSKRARGLVEEEEELVRLRGWKRKEKERRGCRTCGRKEGTRTEGELAVSDRGRECNTDMTSGYARLT